MAVDKYNAKLLDNIEKIQSTAVILLRDCKGIADAAEARANIHSSQTSTSSRTLQATKQLRSEQRPRVSAM